jgi:hypothetical protein
MMDTPLTDEKIEIVQVSRVGTRLSGDGATWEECAQAIPIAAVNTPAVSAMRNLFMQQPPSLSSQQRAIWQFVGMPRSPAVSMRERISGKAVRANDSNLTGADSPGRRRH